MEGFEKTGQSFYNTSFGGHPVYIHKMSNMDVSYVKSQSVQDTEVFYFLLHEKILKVLFPICSDLVDQRVDKIVSIFDMSKVSVFKLFTKVNFVKKNYLKLQKY